MSTSEQTVGSVRSSTDPLDRIAAARDLWPGGTLDFWQGRDAPRPDRIYWPTDRGEVEAVLRHADAEGTPVVPYGAGSGVCGGARGMSGSIVVDAKALDRFGPVDTDRWTVDAEAGVLGQHLEDYLAAHGFTLGHSPSSIWCSTVGGWAAARSAGQFSSRYGVFEDMVLRLEGVAPGIGAFSVGEGGDHPDSWMPLLLGSEGTLGLITKVRMRVSPQPKTRWLRGYRAPDVASALRAMRGLMQNELWPAVVRLYDPVDTRIGGKTKPKSQRSGSAFYKKWLARVDRLPGVRKRTLTLPLALPGVLNRIAGRISSGCLLIVGWEGEPDVVSALSKAGHKLILEHAEDLGAAPGKRWFDSRHAVSYKLMPVFERGGFADTMEVAVRWSKMEELYNAVRDAMSETAVVMAHMSHVYPEGGSIYFSFAGRGDTETYRRTWTNALDAVQAVGATTTHHHGVGRLKAEWATREVGAAQKGYRAMKAELDPNGIMNPGRLYVDVPEVDAGPPPVLDPDDGLVRVPASADLDARRDAASGIGAELMFPWDAASPPPRWQRLPWQIGPTSLSGRVDGTRIELGRGPRSAAGPDLRDWALDNADDVAVTHATVPSGERWMGMGKPKRPWSVARDLLQSDLRPAVLTVRGGRLYVGFRGPASQALGELASAWVPGGLEPIDYAAFPLAGGTLEPTTPGDDKVVAVTPQGFFKRKA